MTIPLRQTIIALLIGALACWSLAAAQTADDDETGYVRPQLVASPAWLREHRESCIVVDVRADEHFDGNLIPDAVRMPWSRFRHDRALLGIASTFVGTGRAAAILGEHGIGRQATVVLYDSVERDGGATASYVFWVLELLGHQGVRVLDGGIDAWIAAGGEVVKQAREPEPITYELEPDDIRREFLVGGDFLYRRLDDPHYTIIDVRSPEEYRGEAGTTGLRDQPLKLGHVPGAVNIPYTRAWIDEESKRLRDQAGLAQLYAGVEAGNTLIIYCNSGRRGSFGYFTARLAGFERVTLYEPSWKQWGLPRAHYPVETRENTLEGETPSLVGDSDGKAGGRQQSAAGGDGGQSAGQPSGGYVSCGG